MVLDFSVSVLESKNFFSHVKFHRKWEMSQVALMEKQTYP